MTIATIATPITTPITAPRGKISASKIKRKVNYSTITSPWFLSRIQHSCLWLKWSLWGISAIGNVTMGGKRPIFPFPSFPLLSLFLFSTVFPFHYSMGSFKFVFTFISLFGYLKNMVLFENASVTEKYRNLFQHDITQSVNH